MKNKRILALLLALCLLALPVLTACSGLDDLDEMLGSGSNSTASSTVPSKPSQESKPTESGKDDSSNDDIKPLPPDPVGPRPEDSLASDSTDTSDNSGKDEKPEKDENVETDRDLGLKFTLSEKGDYYSVSAVKPLDKTHIVIPREYKGIPVTTIEKNAFSGCSNLKSIILPDSLTHISAFSFYKCSSLEAIIIPKGVVVVGSYAFDGCDLLNIYSETSPNPPKWDKKWNPDNLPVTWKFSCEHKLSEATCEEPAVCSVCGAAVGDSLGHDIVDGACTRCDYEEERDDTENSDNDTDTSGSDSVDSSDNNTDTSDNDGTDDGDGNGDADNKDDGEIILDGDNVASLATIVASDIWWAMDTKQLVDNDLTTATLSSPRARYTSFTFTWRKSYHFTALNFVVNGQGYAPLAGIGYSEPTSNEFLFDVALYDENDNVVYEAKGLSSAGVDEYAVKAGVTANKMVFTVHSNFTYLPIFEVEAFTDDATCAHSWLGATCTEPEICELCGIMREKALGHLHSFSETVLPTCEAEGYDIYICSRCGEEKHQNPVSATGHIWNDDKCEICLASKISVGIDEIESITASHENNSTTNLEKLFDGDKMSTGIWTNDTSKEYFPSYSGDYLTITLKNEIDLDSIVIWTCGNWTMARLTVFDANGNKVAEESVIYSSDNPTSVILSTPVEILFDSSIKAKTVVLTAVSLKFEGQSYSGQKTSEIELFHASASCEHNWLDATCTAPKTCSICGATEGEIYFHRFERLVEIVAPTCTEEGYSVYQCLTCEMTERREKTVPINHDFVDGTCSICGMKAEPKLTYAYLNGSVWETATPSLDGKSYTLRTEPKSSGGTVALANGTVVDKEFYGWFDKYGNLYAPGEAVKIDSDLTLYEAYGITVYNAQDLKEVLTHTAARTFVRLGCDITIDSVISANWTTVAIDLNGHTLTSTATSAFYIMRGAFVLVGRGKLVHTPSSADSFASIDFTRHGYGDMENPQLFWIGENVEFTTSVYALRVISTIQNTRVPMPNISISGTVNAKGLALINCVTTDAACEINSSATLNLEDIFIKFDDLTGSNSYMTIAIDGKVNIKIATSLFGCYMGNRITLIDHSHTLSEASCTSPCYCILCDEVIKEAQGHIFAEATCTSAAYCTVCGAEFGEPTGHSLVMSEVPPTCEEMGYSIYSCLLCNYVDEGSKVYTEAALGHEETYDRLEPTCTEKGYEKVYCIVCAITISETEIPMLGHEYNGEYSYVVAPTCTSQGYSAYPCIRCDEIKKEDVQKTLLHSMVDGRCVYCLKEGFFLTPEHFESVSASHDGGGSANLDKLFDGDKSTKGIFSSSDIEYYPTAVGDSLTIVLKEASVLASITLWGCGNWTFSQLSLYDDAGTLLGTYEVRYLDGLNSAPCEFKFEDEALVKTIVLTASSIKWNDGKTHKTSEIDIFAKNEPHTHVYSFDKITVAPTRKSEGTAEASCQCGSTTTMALDKLCSHALNESDYCITCGVNIVNGFELKQNDKSGYTIVGIYACDYNILRYTAPREFNGLPVNAVGALAFCGLAERLDLISNPPSRDFHKIVLPNTITSIGEFAFDKCNSITVSVTAADGSTLYDSLAADWANSVTVAKGNNQFVDVVTDKRPAFGWSIYL